MGSALSAIVILSNRELSASFQEPLLRQYLPCFSGSPSAYCQGLERHLRFYGSEKKALKFEVWIRHCQFRAKCKLKKLDYAIA